MTEYIYHFTGSDVEKWEVLKKCPKTLIVYLPEKGCLGKVQVERKDTIDGSKTHAEFGYWTVSEQVANVMAARYHKKKLDLHKKFYDKYIRDER